MENKVDLSQHRVDTLVVSCADFRFRPLVAEWIGERFGAADLIAVPGASKAIIEAPIMVSWLAMMVELHGVKKIVVADHIDCGAYGGSVTYKEDLAAEVAMHRARLADAERILRQALSGVELEFCILGSEGELRL